MLSGFAVAGADVEISNWEDHEYFETDPELEENEGLSVNVESFNTDNQDREVLETWVQVEDESGNTINDDWDRDTVVESGESETFFDPSFDQADVDTLNDGEVWTITVEEDWEHTTDVSTTVELETGIEGTASTDIQTITHDSMGDPIEVEWESNNYDNIKNGLTTEINLEDESGSEETVFVSRDSFEPDETRTHSYDVEVDDYAELESGEWDITVDDSWFDGEETGQTSSENVESPTFSITIDSPVDGDTIDVAEDPGEREIPLEINLDNDGIAEEFEFDFWSEDQDGNNAFTEDQTIDGDDDYPYIYSLGEDDVFTLDIPIERGTPDLNLDEDIDYEITVTSQESEITKQETGTLTLQEEDLEDPVIDTETTIDDPSTDFDYDYDDELNVEWSSENTGQDNEGDATLDLDETWLRIEDEQGSSINYFDSAYEIKAGDQESFEATFSASDLQDESLNPGEEWTITVEDDWDGSDYFGEDDISSDSVTIDVDEDAEPEEESIDVEIDLTNPSTGNSYDYESGEISLEWDSINNEDSDYSLAETTIVFEDRDGFTQSATIDQEDVEVEADNDQSHQVDLDNSDWDNMITGTNTLTVREEWETGLEVEDDVEIELTENGGTGFEEISADIDASTTLVEVDQEITFDASDSTGQITDYEWDLDDGNTASGSEVDHSYSSEETYNVELEVSNETSSDTETVEITVEEDPDLNAAVNVDDDEVEEGDQVELDGSSSTGNIDEYNWDLDDGTTATGETVTHIFGEAGNYIVELEVTGEDGDTDTNTETITVEEEEIEEDTETTTEQQTGDDGSIFDDDENGDLDTTQDEEDQETEDEEETETTETGESETETGEDFSSRAEDFGPQVAGIPAWLLTLVLVFIGIQIYWWKV